MPVLGDVIEALVRDLYTARALNDAHAAEIFELYKGNDAMRHLAMPVFRIGKMDVSLPLRAISVETQGDPAPPPQSISIDRSIDQAVTAVGELYQLVTRRSLTTIRMKELAAALARALREMPPPLSDQTVVNAWTPIVVDLFRKWRISAKNAGIKDIENRLLTSIVLATPAAAVKAQQKNMQVDFVKSQEAISPESLLTLNFEIREQVARWQLVAGEEEGQFEHVLVVE